MTVAAPQPIIVVLRSGPDSDLAEALTTVATLRYVLFDFDGVIADTENIHVAAWQRTLASLGWEVSDRICAHAAEEDDRVFVAGLFAHDKITNGDIMGWVRRKQELTLTLLKDSPRIYPGVAELVRELRARVRLAVVTRTWRANVEAVLGASGLADAFDLIVSKENVSALMPGANKYTFAMKRLRVAAARAVAVEDSPVGLAAAREAGVRAVAVGHRRPPGDWSAGSEYIADLTQTAKILELLQVPDTSAQG